MIFALDASSSLGPKNFQLQVDAVEEIIIGLSVGQKVRVGVIVYGSEVKVAFQLGDHPTKLDVLNALTVNYLRGSTDTAGAIAAAHAMFSADNGDRADAENILVLFTDGRADDRIAAIETAAAGRSRSRNVFQVIVNVSQCMEFMEIYAIDCGCRNWVQRGSG